MNIVYLAFGLLFGVALAFELANFVVRGWFISKATSMAYMNICEKKLYINSFDRSILMIRGSGYITSFGFSLYSKYYIEGGGLVLRFSKLEKRIDEYYAIALKKELE